MMLVNTICYKTKNPVYYNKGTQYETSCDTFLMSMYWTTKERAQEEADRLNKERPATTGNGEPINWDEIDYFFASEQEDFF